LPNNRSDLYIEEKLKSEIAGRILAGSATIHAATVVCDFLNKNKLLFDFLVKLYFRTTFIIFAK
jgi:hypothetical protein